MQVALQMVETRKHIQKGRPQPAHFLQKNRIGFFACSARHPTNLSQSPAIDWSGAMAGAFLWGMLPAQSSDASFRSTGAASAEITRKEPR